MARVTSNAPDIAAWIQATVRDAFDLSRDNLGDDILDTIAEAIGRRTLEAAQDADGGPIAENQGQYAIDKGSIPVGIGLDDGGEMLSDEQLKGQREISPTEATMTYGTNDRAKTKADWFTRGNEDSEPPRPPRPFYGLDDKMPREVMEDVVLPHLESQLNGG